MSTRRKNSRVLHGHRSFGNRRFRRISQTCCEGLFSRIEQLLDTNRELQDRLNYDAALHKFILKFSLCRPKFQAVRSRLQESCAILSEIDDFLDFFSDPARLGSYLLGEEAQEGAYADQKSPATVETPDTDEVLRERSRPSTTNGESHLSRKPDIDTIIEEVDEGPPSELPSQQQIMAAVDRMEIARESKALALRVSQAPPVYKMTPGKASFEMSTCDRNSPAYLLRGVNFRGNSKRVLRPSAVISSIPYHETRPGRRRRRAIVVEPPEENGAWSGTPMARNPIPDAPVQIDKHGELEERSSNSEERGKVALLLENEVFSTSRTAEPVDGKSRTSTEERPSSVPEHRPIGRTAVVHADGALKEESLANSDHRPDTIGRERVEEEERTRRSAKALGVQLDSRAARDRAKAEAICSSPNLSPPRRTAVDDIVLPRGGVVGSTIPSKRSLRRALTNVCYAESSRKKKRKN
ncbi:uncharacterized protein LOC100908845 [Galendromus occidentalis]|uniref:Uncharacterized protein LOC100908845 n=1 Tax=Galendromus occidentalis TaxID=34638 RepID=A0AAJ6QWL9_9ACAR|nr:uncharacterized protein LOC100908845 [Galendromus occidentalis]